MNVEVVVPRRIYSKEDLITGAPISQSQLDAILDAQLLQPAGKVDGSTPYFDDACLGTVRAITKLLGMGYTVEEAGRIRSKVGLPGQNGTRGRRETGPMLTVGELAGRIGSNPRTIKHWEEKGIIEPDSYSPGGFRLYNEVYVRLCQLIQDLQLFGYSLDEIKAVADLFRDFIAIKDNPGVFPLERTAGKLQVMADQMTALSDKMGQLEKGIKRWRELIRQRRKGIEGIKERVARELRRAKKGQGPDEQRTPAAAGSKGQTQ